jgi:NAD(P)-dependent dehydrogenase (short-subunit alcohol dehydrogenase family)
MNPTAVGTGDFSGKTVVITGATSGIGRQAAQAFAERGAFVIGAGRSPERCQKLEQDLRGAHPAARVRCLVADLAVQSQVRRLAADVRQAIEQAGGQALDVLVNNAGMYAGKYTLTPDGVELTFGVNHLAPFLLTHELLPLIERAAAGRVLTVSSDSHYRTWLNLRRVNRPLVYVGLWAYKVSKLANVLFSKELDRRLRGTRARAFAVDPGLVRTEIGLKGTDLLTRLVWKMRMSAGTDPRAPVQTILHLSGESVQDSPEVYWYDSRPKQPSPQALREDLARQLWAESLRLTGIRAVEGRP